MRRLCGEFKYLLCRRMAIRMASTAQQSHCPPGSLPRAILKNENADAHVTVVVQLLKVYFLFLSR